MKDLVLWPSLGEEGERVGEILVDFIKIVSVLLLLILCVCVCVIVLAFIRLF